METKNVDKEHRSKIQVQNVESVNTKCGKNADTNADKMWIKCG